MGDLFFILRMIIYTLVLVVILQVKVGPTTLEQKLHNITHQSQLAGSLQGIAQGAATFIGVQYNKLAGQVHSKYIEKHSSGQRPGERLKTKFDELKESINQKWEEEKVESEEEASP